MLNKRKMKFLAVLLFLFASFFFLAFQGGKLAYILFVIMLILSMYFALGRFSGIATAKGRRKLQPEENLMFVESGASVSVTIDVQLGSLWFYPYVIVQDRLVNHRGEAIDFECTFIPNWRSQGQVQYATPPLTRGMYRFESTKCTTEDIFGMFQHHGTMKLEEQFRVSPRMVDIKEWTHFYDIMRGNHHHSTTSRAVRETTQINGVRDYVYGDRISRIHWNATARTGTWKSKEFEKEMLPKTIIVLDRDALAYKAGATFELAVSVSSSIFRYAFHEELNVGLLSSGKEATWIEASRGELHFNQVLHHLILTMCDGNRSLMTSLKQQEQRLSKGSFVILVTPRQHESMKEVIGWLHAKKLHACHIQILDEAHNSPTSLQKQLLYNDFRTYAISELRELPQVLGGRG